MKDVMGHYTKKWWLFLICILLLFPAITIGMISLHIIASLGLSLIFTYTVASVICGIISTIPVSLYGIKLKKDVGKPSSIFAIIIVAISIFSVIGFFLMTYRI